MVAVAVVGVVLGALKRRRDRFDAAVHYHRSALVRLYQLESTNAIDATPVPGVVPLEGGELELIDRRIDFHRLMINEYANLASHPWLPEPPDAPEPK